jgi:ribosomal protein S18 acetylase RimI-like enzyme
MIIRALRKEDAHTAARLHREVLPHTFLASLGERFLTALYEVISDSPCAFGFVAEEDGEMIGVGIATTDTRQLFRTTLFRRGWQIIPLLAIRALRFPSLLLRIWETRSYPDKMEAHPGEAELLFVGVRPAYRCRGVWRQLVQARLEECRRRGCSSALAMVEKSNKAMLRLLLKEGFEPQSEFVLYGREVQALRYQLVPQEGSSEEARLD